jgi:hypothetical protein
MVRPLSDSAIPWSALIVGLWIPNFFYWGLNQYIMQRTLASKSLAEGQLGIVFAAFLKLLIPFVVVIPGILAFNLYSNDLRNEGAKKNEVVIAEFSSGAAKVFPFTQNFAALNPELCSKLVAHNSAQVGLTAELGAAPTAEALFKANDAAVAARAMQAEGLANRVLIVDCDVHQGNGTASILRGDDSIFTFSIHGARNFPFDKEQSDLDIELPDGCSDAAYLLRLNEGLDTAFDLARPDLVIYLAGADPYRDDRLGRLALTFDGLAERDRSVFAHCQARRLPLAIAMAGGYARQIEDTVRIHTTTIRLAKALPGG